MLSSSSSSLSSSTNKQLPKRKSDGKFFGDLFPTRHSAAIFLAYMIFFIAQSILVKASQTNKLYTYNVTCVVMLTEILKLLLSSAFYLKGHSLRSLFDEVSKHRKLLLLYLVPAVLYCIYNNLQFRNLQHLDPTTYNLLMQFRVVITGLLFQMLFKKRLSGQQWFSLCLLTFGCVIKQFSVIDIPSRLSGGGILEALFSFDILYLLLQMLCSCLAGVYNEFLLKDTGADMHIMVHNFFMYVDSIVCNLSMLVWNGQTSTLVNAESWRNILFRRIVLLVIANGALCGIIVSVFLRSLNSILKTFAGALDLSFTAVLCWIIFSIPLDMATIIAITIVSVATYLYSRNPVMNKVKDTNLKLTVSDDEAKLLIVERI